jgi:hypothetical protein
LVNKIESSKNYVKPKETSPQRETHTPKRDEKHTFTNSKDTNKIITNETNAKIQTSDQKGVEKQGNHKKSSKNDVKPKDAPPQSGTQSVTNCKKSNKSLSIENKAKTQTCDQKSPNDAKPKTPQSDVKQSEGKQAKQKESKKVDSVALSSQSYTRAILLNSPVLSKKNKSNPVALGLSELNVMGSCIRNKSTKVKQTLHASSLNSLAKRIKNVCKKKTIVKEKSHDTLNAPTSKINVSSSDKHNKSLEIKEKDSVKVIQNEQNLSDDAQKSKNSKLIERKKINEYINNEWDKAFHGGCVKFDDELTKKM